MGGVLPVMGMTGIDDFLHLGDSARKGRIGLIDMEAVFLEHDLDFIPAIVEFGAGNLDFGNLLQGGIAVIIA